MGETTMKIDKAAGTVTIAGTEFLDLSQSKSSGTLYVHPHLNISTNTGGGIVVSPPIPITAAASIDDPPEWRGRLVPLNQPTDETGLRRIFDAAGFKHRDLPIGTKGDHDSMFSKGAAIGNITRLWVEDGWVWGEGVFTETSAGREAKRLAAGGQRNYVSVEINIYHASETDTGEVFIAGEFGDITVTELFVDDWKLIGLAIVDTQAFEGARIEVIDSSAPVALVASAFAQKPPARFFEIPQLDEWTRLTITPEGRIVGHAWKKGQPHIAFDGYNVVPPEDCDFDKWFHRGQVETAEGDLVNVGVITLYSAGAGHQGGADTNEVIRQYDHAATIAAVVRIEYDDIGGAVSGWVLPDLEESDLTRFRAAQVSGHWIDPDGKSGLQLLGLLTVPIQGFPNAGQFLELAAAATPRLASWTCKDGTCTVLAASGAAVEDAVEAIAEETEVEVEVEEVLEVTSGSTESDVEARLNRLEDELSPVIAERHLDAIPDPPPLSEQLDALLEDD